MSQKRVSAAITIRDVSTASQGVVEKLFLVHRALLAAAEGQKAPSVEAPAAAHLDLHSLAGAPTLPTLNGCVTSRASMSV